MQILDNLSLGIEVAFLPANLFYCFIGVLLGTVVGVLPGLGPLATMAMLLPLTYGLEPTQALIMLSGIYYGSTYGGSTTAILVNLPGESSSMVTALDGYQMARKGRAGPALAAAALGSFFAGTVATVLIAFVAGPLTAIAFTFGPAEYFALIVLGLVSSVALASGSVVKAIGMVLLGLLLGLTGMDKFTGEARFTFGFFQLFDGIDFVALSLALFGLGEILRNLETRQDTAKVEVAPVGRLWPTKADLRRIVAPVMRGTAIGSVLGVLPGGGALLSSFIAYNVEKKVSPNAKEFGSGAIEGVAAPESANNAGAQTSFIPMLALGIPSNVVMAIMIGAMIMQGIVPGPDVVTSKPDLFWGLIVSMWIGNLILVVLNLPLVGVWVQLLKIPYKFLFAGIIILSFIGIYSVSNSVFPIYILIIVGVGGYFMVKLGFEPAPLVLGFVLGPMLEEHLRRAMLMYHGDATIFLTRPLSLALLCLSAIALVVVTRPAIARRRAEVFLEED